MLKTYHAEKLLARDRIGMTIFHQLLHKSCLFLSIHLLLLAAESAVEEEPRGQTYEQTAGERPFWAVPMTPEAERYLEMQSRCDATLAVFCKLWRSSSLSVQNKQRRKHICQCKKMGQKMGGIES